MPEKYYLYINRERVEVSEEVCYVFMRSIWNERKRRKYRSKVERSFEKYLELGLSFASEDELVEDIVTDQILLEALFDALQELSAEERELIDALFYQEKTLREAADLFGVSYVAIQRRKTRILEKLKKILG